MTVSVKLCAGDVPLPFVAVKLKLYVPAIPAAGVPLRTPVAVSNAMPVGRVSPLTAKEAGELLAATVKLPAMPTVKAVTFAEVMVGAILLGVL